MKTWFRNALIGLGILGCVAGSYGEVGGGLIIGEPTGVSIRFNKFPVLGVAWSMRNNWMHIHGDYWIIHKQLEAPLNWYLGVGGSIGAGEGIGVGVRVPVGLQFPFERRWELFGELAPVVVLIEETGFDLEGGIGIRYIF